MTRDARCPSCGSVHVDDVHIARCAYRDELRADVAAYAEPLGVPEPTALDLLAHLGDIYQDGSLAHRAAVHLMALGWRPVVGSDAKRLWQPNEGRNDPAAPPTTPPAGRVS